MALPLDDLRARVAGPVLTPADDGFLDEVMGFSLAARYHPDVAVGATSEADVVEAVRFAAANGLPVSVQATGHGAHDGDLVGGLLIVVKRLDSVGIDPAAATAAIGGGAWWAAVIDRAAAHGLAPITGSSPTVGAVGYTIGGGLGPLARSHGFSSDYVLSFRVVTGGGEVKVASRDENSDLYWALRGGKAGFGVVTEMTIRLEPLTEIYGGSLFFDAGDIERVLRGWIAWTATAPDDVTTSVAIIRFPPIEEIPEPLRGKTTINLRFVYPGDADEGERLAAPLRALAPAFIDALGAMPAAKIGLVHNDPADPGSSWSMGGMLTHADDDFATAVLDRFGASAETPLFFIEVRHLGNRTRQDVPEGSAVGGRENAYTLNAVAMLFPGVPEAPILEAWDDLASAIGAWKSPETTINFAAHPPVAAFPSSWPPQIYARLEQVAKSHDPEGLFTWR